MTLSDWERLKFATQKDKLVRNFDQFMYNLQVGKIFGPLAVRTGLFYSTLGVGIDINIPYNEYLRWTTTLEGYDFRGRQRIDDSRPHVKWLNRVYVTPNLYMVFGADDVASRHNKSVFAGVGLQFADDDLKYFASKFN